MQVYIANLENTSREICRSIAVVCEGEAAAGRYVAAFGWKGSFSLSLIETTASVLAEPAGIRTSSTLSASHMAAWTRMFIPLYRRLRSCSFFSDPEKSASGV